MSTTTFKTIKGYSNYEANEAGTVRNIKSQKELTVKKGTESFYLKNDAGEMKLIAFAKMKLVEPKPEKSAKAEKPVKEKKVKVLPDVQALMSKPKTAKIVNDETIAKHRKVYELNQAGLTNSEIAALLGMSNGNVSRDLWGYKTERYLLD
jgi:hypothetical protein